MPQSIAENLAAVRSRMAEAARRAGRNPDGVRLIAVSKTHPPEAVREAMAAGQRLFGENRVQEAVAKIEAVGQPGAAGQLPAVGSGPEWHLIGHLQTNKAKQVPGHFHAVHSVDSERLAKALNGHVAAGAPKLQVFLQLNLHREASKSGMEDYAAAGQLLAAIRQMPGLEPAGLMTIPDPALSESLTRAHFAEVRGMLEKLRAEFAPGPAFRELSMGMSHDFEWAIAEGATLVRVGTAIFGVRGTQLT
jgi:hypothetical protein